MKHNKLKPTFIYSEGNLLDFEVCFDFHLDGWYGYLKDLPIINFKAQSKDVILNNLKQQLDKYLEVKE